MREGGGPRGCGSPSAYICPVCHTTSQLGRIVSQSAMGFHEDAFPAEPPAGDQPRGGQEGPSGLAFGFPTHPVTGHARPGCALQNESVSRWTAGGWL
jgi:hypothetical protein